MKNIYAMRWFRGGKYGKNNQALKARRDLGISYCSITDKIPELRKRYNLKELNEEILKYGKPVKYRKPIY